MAQLRTLLDGLAFPEGPRWNEGRLWFSDMHRDRVIALDLDGNAETIAEVAGRPSGLGWDPEGRLLIVSMVDRRLLRLDPEGLTEVALLGHLAPWHCNDMLVDEQGRAYIGNFGWDHEKQSGPVATRMLRVDPDGTVHVAAEDLLFPNGTVLTPDGRTLVVGETYGARLTAFDVDADGALSNRRTWAELEGAVPDGICLDTEGAIWVACPVSGRVLRIREGGEVLDTVEVEHKAFACMLGGPTGNHLFVCTAPDSDRDACRRLRGGRIEILEVDTPQAGLP